MHFEIFSSQSVIAREDREVGMITIRLTGSGHYGDNSDTDLSTHLG